MRTPNAGRWYLDAAIPQPVPSGFVFVNFDREDFAIGGVECEHVTIPMVGTLTLYRVKHGGLYLVTAAFTIATTVAGAVNFASIRMNFHAPDGVIMAPPYRRSAMFPLLPPSDPVTFHFATQARLARFEAVSFDFTTDGEASMVGLGLTGADDLSWVELARVGDLRVVRD